MPIIGPELPHGSLGEIRPLKQGPEVLPPEVERSTEQPKTVSEVKPELPHGSLGEFRAPKQKSLPPRAEVVPPEVVRPPNRGT